MIEGKDPRQMTTSPALPAWWRRWRAKRVQRLNHKYQRQEWIRTAQLAPFDPPPPKPRKRRITLKAKDPHHG